MFLKRKNQKSLFEPSRPLKFSEELILLRFISLLMTVFQESRVRVNALRCLGDLVPSLDKQAVLEILQTLQRSALDHSAPTLMCTLGVSHAIYKQFGLEFAVEHVLPQVLPLVMAQQLSFQQFVKYMLFVKDVLRKIEEKRGVTLTEYEIFEARVSPSLSNELHSKPYQKHSGPIPAAKKTTTTSWDEDWGPINRRNATTSNPPTSNSTSTFLQSLTPAVIQQTTSIPPVDVEWPPPNSSSIFVSQSLTNDKTFDDIDPFANWPPRPNGSSKPYQESAVSINSMNNTFAGGNEITNDSLAIGRKANVDIGSIFAPKLAPPPLTAIGRGRGRNQVSLSSQTKPSSQRSPILNLL